MAKFAALFAGGGAAAGGAAAGTAAAGGTAAAAGGASAGLFGSGITLGQVVSFAGSALAASSALQQGRSDETTADYQAQLLEREAVHERLLSQQEADEAARQGRRLRAAQRARQGGSGTQVGTGTPLLLAQDTAAEVEFQRQNILTGGKTTSSKLRSQADLARFKGKSARRLGRGKAGSALLSGAGTLFGKD